MGHSGKQKKKHRGRKGKSRAPSHDYGAGDAQDLLSDELIALTAIFQDDIQMLSRPPQAHVMINIRPHSDETGHENLNVSAVMSLRCSLGYPYKCPKIHIEPEKGLKQDDVDKLLSLLLDQANSNAREGRVMIFNLVEAAQEFLSEILALQEANECCTKSLCDENGALHHGGASILYGNTGYSEGPFVYGPCDLFSDVCGDDRTWPQSTGAVVADDHNKVANDNTVFIVRDIRKRVAARPLDALCTSVIADNHILVKLGHNTSNNVVNNTQDLLPLVNEYVPKECHDDDSEVVSPTVSNASGESLVEDDDSLPIATTLYAKDGCLKGQHLKSQPSVSEQDEKFNIEKKDLLMVYLLRLACSTKGSLAQALPEITSELSKIGMISDKAKDLAAESPLAFNSIFNNAFQQHLGSSSISHFWKDCFTSEENASAPNSRYLNDFEEIRFLGRGGFGNVVLCKNKLDGRQYAVKRIRLKNKSSPFNEKILREVATLSRLQHQHVVRYYQAWFENGVGYHDGGGTCDVLVTESSYSCAGSCSAHAFGAQNKQDATYLYIQMEYCPRTLHQDFETYERFTDKELTWHQFRQIVEGLAHIHSQGIIHRDLTPNNIFFDARNEVKIGDFGLAKFLKLEHLDQDHLFPIDTNDSIDGTGQVGTYFYTAPEIEQGWPQIDEKVDMYSLGVVFFELWYSFGTAMERHNVLSDLKSKGSIPSAWAAEFPEQSSLVQRLMSPIPSERPSAKELLRNELPPRMEDEWLNDILRTIQSSEDTYVYDRVISTIFDEDRVALKTHRHHNEKAKIRPDEASFVQYSELDSALRDNVTEGSKMVFTKHGASRLEIAPIRLLDGRLHSKRNIVKLLSSGGNMLELCHELRSPFLSWIASKQKLSFKRYEIACVYRRGIGHSQPNRFLQGDFDIIGGTSSLTVAEAIKVAIEIGTHFFHSGYLDIRLNHGHILAAIWSWVGIEGARRQSVADVLSSLNAYAPQSAKRKSQWVLIRRQLLQGLHLAKSVVDRLQAVDSRFCGSAGQSLARLRGALSPADLTRKALEEISALVNYFRVWKIEENISLDVLMIPEENFREGLHFQIYSVNENSFGAMTEPQLFAIGGGYDHLLQTLWDHKSSLLPTAAGVSIGLEKIIHHPSADTKLPRNETCTTVLVCSRGGGGLLEERMELVAELWEENIKADFVPIPGCSLTAQYDYASEHDIKLLIIITESGLSQTGSVEVRNLELKREKTVERVELVKFLTNAASTQFRSLSIWTQQ